LIKHAVSPSAFGLTGKKVVAVLREQGAIVGGDKSQSGQITAEPLIQKLRAIAEDNSIAGVVLRVDSPGACLSCLWCIIPAYHVLFNSSPCGHDTMA
jgi:hypothetical protein